MDEFQAALDADLAADPALGGSDNDDDVDCQSPVDEPCW
jgi:hypothetical protein